MEISQKKDKSYYIQKNYPVTDDEYCVLDKKYGKLCWDAARKLANKNKSDQHSLEDFHSEVVLGMCRGGSYYKRQIFIEECFDGLDNKIYMDFKDIDVFTNLKKIWKKRKGRFCIKEEKYLCELISKYNCDVFVKNLTFDRKFEVYCKAIIWNTAKNIGQNITQKRKYVKSEISLDEWAFLARDKDEFGNDIDAATHDELNDNFHYNLNFNDDIEYINQKLSSLSDSRALEVFNVLADPNNYDSVFNKKDNENSIKINVVRKKTKMNYFMINRQLEKIKSVLMEEFGEHIQ